MKKIILILLLILPVVVVVMAYLLAGFIGRGLTVIPISGVSVDYNTAAQRNVLPRVPDENLFQVTGATVGATIDLTEFVTVQPAGARFEHILFEVVYLDSNPVEVSEAITINPRTGVMTFVETTNRWIEVRMGDGWNVFMTIWVFSIV